MSLIVSSAVGLKVLVPDVAVSMAATVVVKKKTWNTVYKPKVSFIV